MNIMYVQSQTSNERGIGRIFSQLVLVDGEKKFSMPNFEVPELAAANDLCGNNPGRWKRVRTDLNSSLYERRVSGNVLSESRIAELFRLYVEKCWCGTIGHSQAEEILGWADKLGVNKLELPFVRFACDKKNVVTCYVCHHEGMFRFSDGKHS